MLMLPQPGPLNLQQSQCTGELQPIEQSRLITTTFGQLTTFRVYPQSPSVRSHGGCVRSSLGQHDDWLR